MDWQAELITAFFWLFKAFFWVALSLSVFAYGLKFTPFGQKFWHIARPCLDRTNVVKALAMIGVLILFVLLEVKISVLNTQFYNKLYSSLQDMNAQAFWFFALLNASLMMFKVAQEVVDRFVGEAFEIKWLERFNSVLLERYLADKNYYRLRHAHAPDNIDQRIEQDAKEFITTTVEMVRGVLNAVMSIIEFTVILWGLSGILSLFGLSIPKGVVFFIYAFIIVATALSVWIGKPLIRLNFDKERLHGDYRYSLIRVADNAESIAFYDGEKQEKRQLSERFSAIITNRWAIVRRMLGLDGFNTGVTQFAMLLPLMLQAPRFFAGEIKLGDMHQTVQSFNRLMRALSFFRLFYETFTLYQARLNRLHGFLSRVDKLGELPKTTTKTDGMALVLQNFGVLTADSQSLISAVNITLKSGDALLIQGKSGVGKTTLLKAMAGIYPFETTGNLTMPNAKTLFLPQRPYMPQGTLKEAICYPDITASDTDIVRAMTMCHLSKHTHALDVVGDWQANLSIGELQRVAFVRALLVKPLVIFLDETTSAVDEPTEFALYTTLKNELPHAIIVSVGHRSTLNGFHNQVLRL
ncbi:ABC transporter ATP-binding protein/permease [Moraxella nasibovis]|uniref:ABC transporter ATP-binding protein/permease n=1 Tax=Moraxella nasibovis TaxID=2904120 RepID=UPI00240FEF01|nr:ABC transporter ATP-binding protein/permease [Moraxella nasibovis]WFF38575.1 ABC transporter ATP-binding protein/permease [Moraxella nasibovis]